MLSELVAAFSIAMGFKTHRYPVIAFAIFKCDFPVGIAVYKPKIKTGSYICRYQLIDRRLQTNF